MKRRYQIIILLMVISLFGIILIQVLWIRSAIKAEEERFDKAVYNALSNGIENLRDRDLYYFMDGKIELPAPPVLYDSILETYIPSPVSVEVLKVDTSDPKYAYAGATMVIKDSNTKSKTVTIVKPEGSYIVDWTIDEGVDVDHDVDVEYHDHTEDLFKDGEVIVKDGEILRYPELIELEDLEALEELKMAEQYVILEDQLDSIEDIIRARQKMREEKEEVVRVKMKEFNKVMQQWAFEYSFDEPGFSAEFAREEKIDTVIGRALKNNGINLTFETQLVKEEEDTTVVLTNQVSDLYAESRYRTELFPNDIFRKNMFLVVDFPGRSRHIYSSVSYLGLGSLVFTSIILLTFWMTLYYIRKQKKLSEIKSDFINNMTHEFKTPIATINLASDTMGSPKVMGNEEKIRYYLDIIRQENKRMNNQVEKVLQMALIENQDFQLDFQKTDVHSIIENTVRVAELNAREKGGKIAAVLRATCSEIPVDEIHFANIINNLLDNALKYTEKEPEILVETFTNNQKIFVRISDNGVGMSKEVQKHIFDKFYRRPSGNIHNIKGFGLGLSYVKAIVDAHGGDITVSSEPGNGSIFTLSFDC